MKRYSLFFCVLSMIVAIGTSSCNEEWNEEQYAHYVSFKAPMNYAKGVTDIYVKYKTEGEAHYQLPVILSGSIMNDQELRVEVAEDPDTLDAINWELFHNRKDLYYRRLADNYYRMSSMSAIIPAGECMGLLDINFTLNGIDLVDKWVLPLTIKESPDGSYVPNPRKNYKKALLRVIPFNDYSGTYSTTNMSVYFKGEERNVMTANTRTAFVAGESSIFFYAGLIDEEEQDRHLYKVIIQLNDDGTVFLSAPEGDRIGFKVLKSPTWRVTERMDTSLPYLKHKFVFIEGLEYEFNDITSAPGTAIGYIVKGSVNMERKINMQIPDEDQAIEW